MGDVYYEVHGKIAGFDGLVEKDGADYLEDANDIYDGMSATGEYSEVKIYQVVKTYTEVER